MTVGEWGGSYVTGNRRCWRVCVGWLALTYFRGEFSAALRAWLDLTEADRG